MDNITGLQTARILADRGIPVTGIASDLRHFGAKTNACAEVVQADCDSGELIDVLNSLASRLGGPTVLIPCHDAAVSVLSKGRHQLRDQFRLPLSEHDVVDLLMDKSRFALHATAVGLAAPHTRVLADRADAEAAAVTMPYPCVLKPPVKTPAWLKHTAAKAYLAVNADELLSVYERVCGWSPQLIAQEWVEGGEDGLFSCNAYFDRDGAALVTFVARKLRQWPPGVGTSASGVECRNDAVLSEAVKLFGGVGFHGLAYLEMKRDTRTGRLLIIEPNVGRPTGRSAIAEGGGVELIYTAYCDAVGLPLPAARHQRYVGTKWLDLRRDVQAAVVAHRRGQLTTGEWVRSLRGPKAHAIWSGRDPMPFVTDLARSASTAATALVRRIAPGHRAVEANHRGSRPLGGTVRS